MRHTEQELLGVLDALYEGMLDDAAWQPALVRLADFVSGSAVALFSLNPQTGLVHRADIARIDPQVMRGYQETWIHQDPRHTAALVCPIGEPQVDGMLISTRAFHRSAAFNEFFKPADIPYHVATWIERRPTRGVVLSIQGTWARGAFNDTDRSNMSMLIPHVRRVVEMKDRMAQAKLTADGLLEAFDRLPFGLLVLAANLEILEASAVARSVLARRSGIHADNGQLGFVRSVDQRAFGARLQDPTRACLTDTLHISRGDLRSPLSLLVLPLKASQEQWMRPAARWLVLVFDPECSPKLSESTLQHALNITPSEAAVAQRIASGLSVKQIATELGVSMHTVRAQLKSIYAKTGLSSQAQLVRRILTGPTLVSPPRR